MAPGLEWFNSEMQRLVKKLIAVARMTERRRTRRIRHGLNRTVTLRD